MSLRTFAWKLASPYDAYVSHVARLNQAIEQLRYLADRALGYEAGMHGSLRLLPASDSTERIDRFRLQLGEAGQDMSDEDLEAMFEHLGGGAAADVEGAREQMASRLSHTTRGFAEYYALAHEQLSILEERGYNPARPDVARQLSENHLPKSTAGEYRQVLRELGARVGQSA